MAPKDLSKILPAKICLHATQSPVNFGQVLRACEMFHVWVKIYDPKGVFNDPEKWKTISDFSAGAIDRASDKLIIDDFTAYKAEAKKLGRVVATCLNKDATPLHEFRFEDHDMVLIGNEYDGLPKELIDQADVKLYVPMAPGYVPKPKSFTPIDATRQEQGDVSQQGLPNLSVSQTASIIAYKIFEQRLEIPEVKEAVDAFKTENV